MKELLAKLSVTFAAGSLGGLLNGLAIWIFGAFGITALFDVKIAPALTVQWLYPRIVWGGLWGWLFLLGFLPGSPVLRGAVYSIAPTLVQLFVVFPIQAGKGMLGAELGPLTPLFVVGFNLVWGIAASLWLSLVEARSGRQSASGTAMHGDLAPQPSR
ncbi:MAG: hypothetical protein HY914_17285 [Desulfomonile tiedjei]|nr:hypothetical protein [Desulfomonile tiedjei]